MLTDPPIHNYINRFISRLKFKIKDAYKLELQTPEIMKLMWLRKVNRQDKEWREVTEATGEFRANKVADKIIKKYMSLI